MTNDNTVTSPFNEVSSYWMPRGHQHSLHSISSTPALASSHRRGNTTVQRFTQRPFHIPPSAIYENPTDIETVLRQAKSAGERTFSTRPTRAKDALRKLDDEVEQDQSALDRYLVLCNQKAHLEAQLRLLEVHMERKAHERKKYTVPHKYSLHDLKAPPALVGRKVHSDEVFRLSASQNGIPVHIVVAPSEPDPSAVLPLPQSPLAVRLPSNPSFNQRYVPRDKNSIDLKSDSKQKHLELHYAHADFVDASQSLQHFVDALEEPMVPSLNASQSLRPRSIAIGVDGMRSEGSWHRTQPCYRDGVEWEQFHRLQEDAHEEVQRVVSSSMGRLSWNHVPNRQNERMEPSSHRRRSPPKPVGPSWQGGTTTPKKIFSPDSSFQSNDMLLPDLMDENGHPVRCMHAGKERLLQITRTTTGSMTILRPEIRDLLMSSF